MRNLSEFKMIDILFFFLIFIFIYFLILDLELGVKYDIIHDYHNCHKLVTVTFT